MTQGSDTQVARITARHNLFAGLALAAFAAFMFWQSFTISLDFVDEEGIGPRFFPQAICFAFGGIGLVMAAMGLMGRTAPADKSSFEARRFFLDAVPLFVLGLAFVWGFQAIGYFAATLLMVLAAMWLFGVRGRALWIQPPLVALGLYLIFFKLMRIYEPTATILNPLSLIGLN